MLDTHVNSQQGAQLWEPNTAPMSVPWRPEEPFGGNKLNQALYKESMATVEFFKTQVSSVIIDTTHILLIFLSTVCRDSDF